MTVDALLARLGHSVIHEAASSNAITDLEQKIGKAFPALYSELMRRTNGVEGFLSEVNYLLLWNIEQLVELNESYGVQEFAPGLFLIGSNGGDAAYAFDTRSDPMPVVEVPFIGLSLEEARQVGTSFEDFINGLSAQ